MKGVGLNEDENFDKDRKCDLGFLRQIYQLEGGGVGYRCPAAPKSYMLAGGSREETEGKRCSATRSSPTSDWGNSEVASSKNPCSPAATHRAA